MKANISIFQANEKRWDIVNYPDNNRARLLQLSYHDNMHYASVSVLNQINEVKGVPIGKTNNNTKHMPAAKSFMGPTVEEQTIMNATGITDLILIKETLETFQDDLDDVYNYLFSLLESNPTPEAIANPPPKKKEDKETIK